MHDILLQLFAYFFLPVSTVLLLLLLFPLGNLLHTRLLSLCTLHSVAGFPFIPHITGLSMLVLAYYSYLVFAFEDGIEDTGLITESNLAYGKVKRWHLERNFHLSLLLCLNMM